MRLTYLIALFALFNIDMTESRPVPDDDEFNSDALQLLTLLAIVGIIGSTIYWAQQRNYKKAMAAAKELDAVKLNSEELKDHDLKGIKNDLKIFRTTGAFGEHLRKLLTSYNIAVANQIAEKARSAPHDLVLPDGTRVSREQAEKLGEVAAEHPGMSPAQYNQALESPEHRNAREQANKSMIDRFNKMAEPLINSDFFKKLTANPNNKGLTEYKDRLDWLKALEANPARLNTMITEVLEQDIKKVGEMTVEISDALRDHVADDVHQDVKTALENLKQAGGAMQEFRQTEIKLDLTETMNVLSHSGAVPLEEFKVDLSKPIGKESMRF